MGASSVRARSFAHTWSSLISTLLMLLLRLTGLPLALIAWHVGKACLGGADAPRNRAARRT